jgi:hypothetical protein
MTGTADSAPPAAPVTLSMFDPVHIGIDEVGHAVWVPVIYKNVLAAGEPGGGKSASCKPSPRTRHCRLCAAWCLFDGKLVELGLLKAVADEFVGPDIGKAIITLRRLQRVMDNRYAWLEACGRRKIEPSDGITTITAIFDEIALFSAVLGDERQQKEFVVLLRDLVARGRAAAIIVIAEAGGNPLAGVHPVSEPAVLSRLRGRQVEIETLGDQLNAAQACQGGAMLVAGLAGIGKTVLLDADFTDPDGNAWTILEIGYHAAAGAAR